MAEEFTVGWLSAFLALLMGRPVGSVALVATPTVDVYVYWAVESQTDGAPLQPADSTVSYADVDPAKERHCALSQDLLWFTGGPARFGDYVVFDHPDILSLWRVSDAMHGSVTQSADLLVPEGQFGLWRGVHAMIIRGEDYAVRTKNRRHVVGRHRRARRVFESALFGVGFPGGPRGVE